MKAGSCLILLSLSFLFAVQTPAQQTTSPAPTRDPAAVALLGKSLAVMTGGLPVSDVTLRGTARRIAGSDDESGTAVLKAIAAGASRLDLSFPSGTRAEVCDASGTIPAGTWAGPDGASHAIAYHNLLTEPAWFFPAIAISHALSLPGRGMTYVGHELRDSIAVEHLTVFQQPSDSSPAAALLQHLGQMDLYLDSSTLLPVALAFNVHPDNDAGLDIPVEVRVSDYRLVNGVQVPFRVQKYLNNGLVLDLQLQTVTLNTGLTAAAFSVQ